MAVKADRIVLVGLPGSGKSTVGPLLAQRLGWRFIDLDAEIEAAAGMRVAQLFELRGESEFRRVERELTDRLGCEARFVLSPGGGWLMHNQLSGALLVWLEVEPQEAIKRLGERAAERPLLRPDPFERMKQLLAQRAQHYEKAELRIDTNGRTAAEVADAIVVAAAD